MQTYVNAFSITIVDEIRLLIEELSRIFVWGKGQNQMIFWRVVD